jgi:hypothetical protein
MNQFRLTKSVGLPVAETILPELFNLALPSSDPAGLKAFVDRVSAPGDSLFRQFITPQEFANRFGGSASDYQFLKDWAVSNDLTISQESVGRTTLTVRGSVAVLNQPRVSFGVAGFFALSPCRRVAFDGVLQLRSVV